MNFKEKLLSPVTTPEFTLLNRIIMAPMSRRRSEKGVPGESVAIYYGQRASAGLIITENSAVSPNGIGYLNAPGIYNIAQKEAWKRVVGEVHNKNGKIFVQLVHTGRIGHHLNNENGEHLVAPSAITARLNTRTALDRAVPMPVPHPLTTSGARDHIEAHIQAARDAIEIGFDGVEIHGAHGFLPEQFMHPYTNHRTDQYGGSIANRSRFLLEIMEGVIGAIGKDRTGIRLSPFAALNDLPPYAEEATTHQYITVALQQMDILYLHLSDASQHRYPSIPFEFVQDVRKRFSNMLILAGGFTADFAEATLQAGLADLIAFGRPFIANPDLVERFRENIPLAIGNTNTYYEGGDTGYIDYPAAYHDPSPCRVAV